MVNLAQDRVRQKNRVKTEGAWLFIGVEDEKKNLFYKSSKNRKNHIKSFSKTFVNHSYFLEYCLG